MKQQKLFREKTNSEFGGSLLKGKRRAKRPLNFKLPAHLVLKATNSFILVFSKTEVEEILRGYAKRMGLRLYDCGVHADHIHLPGLFPSRQSYVRWIRAVTSVLVQRFKGLKWRLRPYTRISRWGKSFERLKAYILKNRREGDFIFGAHETVRSFVDRCREQFSRPPAPAEACN